MNNANSTLLKELFAQHAVALDSHDLLWHVPPALPAWFSFERIEGMLLGLAVGDALGNTSEGQNPDVRAARYGQITDYLPSRYAGGQSAGLPSDDTQMAFWTLEVLLEDGTLDPDHLARRFSQERIFGIGHSVVDFLAAYKSSGDWRTAGRPSAGNGALMRIAPVLLPHLKSPTCGLWADAVLAGMVTHNDRASNAACTAFVALLWDLLGMQTPPQPDWWLEHYLQAARPLEGEQTAYAPRMKGLDYSGPLWRFAEQQLQRASASRWSILQACNTWGSGAYLLETLPSVLYILMHFGHDPEQAILRAVNDTRDNDTVAAIVGAAVGALHGKTALPKRWLDRLLGRTNDRDDGHIFDLIDQARVRFWDNV